MSKPIPSLVPLDTPIGSVVSRRLRMVTAAEMFSDVLRHSQESRQRLDRYMLVKGEHNVYRNAGSATQQSRAIARDAVDSLAQLMQDRCGIDSDPACRNVQQYNLSHDQNLAVTALWHSVDRLAEWFREHPNTKDLPPLLRDDFTKSVDLFTAAIPPEPELTPTDSRNKFCYEEWQRGQTQKEIWIALKHHPEWDSLSDSRAVRGPIHKWAEKNKLAVRPGQPGRPKRAK